MMESKTTRGALDRVETVAVVRGQEVDEVAARQALEFMHALGASLRKAPRRSCNSSGLRSSPNEEKGMLAIAAISGA